MEKIREIVLDDDVKSIVVSSDDTGNDISADEIYVVTNTTNIEGQTAATSIAVRLNGELTSFIGTSTAMSIAGGAYGSIGRNWAWIKSINPLIVFTGSWLTTNISDNKTVNCWQPNDLNNTTGAAIENPYSVGEKINSIELYAGRSTSNFAHGSKFVIFGR